MIKGGANLGSMSAQVQGVRINSSVYGKAVKLLYGVTQAAPDLIWYNDWASHDKPVNTRLQYMVGGYSPQKKSGKKGSSIKYFSAAVDMLLGHAPIQGVLSAWYNNYKLACITSSISGKITNGQFTFIPVGGESKVRFRYHVPATGPYTVKVDAFVADISVEIDHHGGKVPWIYQVTGGAPNNQNFLNRGDPAIPPGIFEYTVDENGLYTFNLAQAGQDVWISYFMFKAAGTAPVRLAGIYSVCLHEDYNVTFNDYGGPGEVKRWGTWERPLWNSYFAAPGRIDSGAFRHHDPYTWWWDGVNPTIKVPPQLEGMSVTVYYSVPMIMVSPTVNQSDFITWWNQWTASAETPLELLNCQFERAIGSGTEYTRHPAEQIIQDWACGISSSSFDLGAQNAIPNLNLEVVGAYTLWPNGDCDVADVITDILCSGPTLLGDFGEPGRSQSPVVSISSYPILVNSVLGHNTSSSSSYNKYNFPLNFTGVSSIGTVNSNLMDDSENPAAPAHISEQNVHALFPNFLGPVLAHVTPWFGKPGHVDIGVRNNTDAWAKTAVDDMIYRGIDGCIIDWYGPGSYEDQATQKLKTYIESLPTGTPFTFSICIDKNAITNQASLITAINYVAANYFVSSRYQTHTSKPLLTFFDVQTLPGIDLAAVKAGTATAFWQFNEHASDAAYTDGSFSWVDPINTPVGQYGTNYLDDYFANINPGKTHMASVWPKFNGTLTKDPNWSYGKYIAHGNGHCWLDVCTHCNTNRPNSIWAIQIVTWNDWEEGTQIEGGIENYITVNASMNGKILTWSASGETLVKQYQIYLTQDTNSAILIASVPTSIHTFDFSGVGGLTPGQQYFGFVEAEGFPCFHDHGSPSFGFTA